MENSTKMGADSSAKNTPNANINLPNFCAQAQNFGGLMKKDFFGRL